MIFYNISTRMGDKEDKLVTMLRVHTDYDLENMEELQRVVGRRFTRKQTLGKRTFFLSWGVVCLAVGLYLALRRGSVVLALLCCVTGCLFLGSGLFFYQLTAWTALRAMGGNQGGSEFTLDKTGIQVVRGKAGAHFPYQSCTHLLETHRNLYVITQDGQGLILDKERVRGGSADELLHTLEERCSLTAVWAGRGKPSKGA